MSKVSKGKVYHVWLQSLYDIEDALVFEPVDDVGLIANGACARDFVDGWPSSSVLEIGRAHV